MGAIHQVLLSFPAATSPSGAVTWDGITGATESPTGVLTKTASDAWGNCGAVSVETQAGDCRLAIYHEDQSKNYFIGIDPASSCNTYSGIDFAIHCNGNELAIYHSGAFITSSFLTGGQKGMVVIERIGTTFDIYGLNYSGSKPAPDDPGRSHSNGPTSGTGSTLYVNLAMYFNANSVIDAANLLWQAI